MFYSNSSKTIALSVGVLAMVFLIGYFVFAWQEPTAPPPEDNVPAPLNVSGNAQVKLGPLVVAFQEAAVPDAGFIVRYGNVGIGTTAPGAKLVVIDTNPSTSWVTSNFQGYHTITSHFIFQNQAGGNAAVQIRGKEETGVKFANFQMEPNANNRAGISGNVGSFYINAGNVGIGTTNPGTYKLYVNGNVAAAAFYYTSDINLKTDIQPLSNSLEKILNLQGVSFNWKDSNEPSIGLIAQEVEKIFPELVSGPEGEKTIDYARLVAPLIEAIKEQQKEIEELKAEVNELKLKIK